MNIVNQHFIVMSRFFWLILTSDHSVVPHHALKCISTLEYYQVESCALLLTTFGGLRIHMYRKSEKGFFGGH